MTASRMEPTLFVRCCKPKVCDAQKRANGYMVGFAIVGKLLRLPDYCWQASIMRQQQAAMACNLPLDKEHQQANIQPRECALYVLWLS